MSTYYRLAIAVAFIGASGASLVLIKSANALTGIAWIYYYKGAHTAGGANDDPNELTAAHETLAFGTKVLVTNTRNGKTVVVRINDRGPFNVGG